MIKYYFKIAFRNLLKYKSFSLINILGLAIGISSCLIIFLYIHDQLSYDKFYKNSNDIYRLTLDIKRGNETNKYSTTSPPIGPYLVQNFPEVKEALRIRIGSASLMESDSFKSYEENILFADSNFFNLFSFPLAEGNPGKVLSEPNTVVLTSETAKKYFGDENPVGKIIEMDKRFPLKVTGIIYPGKYKSHIKFDFLISFSTFPSTLPPGYSINDWGWTSFFTYLVIENQPDVKKLEEKLPGMINTNFRKETAQRLSLHLEPLKDIFFDRERLGDFGISGNKSSLFTIGIIALMSLIIAGFNFINLSTARSANRGKEIGIRKMHGAKRIQLIIQFLSETIIIVFISLMISIVIIELIIPYLSDSINLHIQITDLNLFYYVGLFTVFPIILGILAGIFPAFMMSNFIHAKILKKQFYTGPSGISLRKALIVAQFLISTILIAGALIISSQMNFIREKNLGFNKDRVVVLKLRGLKLLNKFETIKTSMSNIPDVISVGGARNSLDGGYGTNTVIVENSQKNTLDRYDMNTYPVNFGFFKTLDLKFISGRGFNKKFASDSSAVILNESAVKLFGLDKPLNSKIKFGNDPQGKVIGVVKDFNYTSLHNKIEPLVFYFSPDNSENMFIKIAGRDLLSTIQIIKKRWNDLLPNYPIEYSFLDKKIEQIYRSDEKNASLINYFSGLAILIACIGLFGLVSFSAEQRTKEIGVRKVLGASVFDIVKIFTGSYMKLILIAIVIACPLSYYFLNLWLLDFAYRINISVWNFILSGIIVLLIAIITVSYQTIKAASANPVESLRYE